MIFFSCFATLRGGLRRKERVLLEHLFAALKGRSSTKGAHPRKPTAEGGYHPNKPKPGSLGTPGCAT